MSTQPTTRGIWIGAIMALAVAVPISAQGDPRLDRVRAELPDAAVQRIQQRIEVARSQGLPTGALLDKALEGIAKGVPAPLIAGAVDQLAQDLGRARELLAYGAPPDPSDVTAVADAMRRGVPGPAIQRFSQGADPEEPIALAVHTLGDLMDRGVPVDQAMAVLEAWRGRGARGEDLRGLPAAVERLIRQGVLPGQAAAAVANAMRGGPPGAGGGPGGQPPGAGHQGGPPIPPGAGPPSEHGQGQGHGQGPPGGSGG